MAGREGSADEVENELRVCVDDQGLDVMRIFFFSLKWIL
jgi:hypothetical protein